MEFLIIKNVTFRWLNKPIKKVVKTIKLSHHVCSHIIIHKNKMHYIILYYFFQYIPIVKYINFTHNNKKKRNIYNQIPVYITQKPKWVKEKPPQKASLWQ